MDMLLLGLVPGIPQAALRVIRDRAAGVPLYAVETVRMLLDQGRLSESGGRFRLDDDLGDLAVPDSLQSLIGARLDTLDEPSRQLVGVASVLGLSVGIEALAALVARPTADIRSMLDGLAAREVLVRDDGAVSPERGQYQFIQGVLRDVAYGRLSRRDRLALHLAAAAYFETSGSDELAGIVASHYLSALRSAPDDSDRDDLAARAGSALEAAADRARGIGAHASAAGYLAEALALTTDDDSRLRLLEARADALGDAGQLEESEAAAREVLEAGLARGDLGRAARGGTIEIQAIITSGRPGVAVIEAERIRALLGPVTGEDPDAIRLTAELARAYLMSGSPTAARDLIETILPTADRLGLREVVAQLLPSRAWAISSEGRSIEAIALLRGALVFAEREGLFNAEMRCRMNLSSWLFRESPAESFEIAWAGSRRARERGYMGWATSAGGNAADCAFMIGEWDQVEAMTQEVDALRAWTTPWDFTMPSSLATVWAYRGRLTETRELLARFDAQFPDVVDPQLQVTVLMARAHLTFAEGHLEDAIGQTRQIDRLLEGLGTGGEHWLGGMIALERRDIGRLKEVIQGLEARAVSRMTSVEGDLLRGGLRVLEGDLDGLAALDAAIVKFRIEGLGFPLALCLRARAMLEPDADGAAAAAAEARAVIGELGAVTLLRGLPGGAAAAGPPPDEIAGPLSTTVGRTANERSW